ncbi:class I SAM-dependent methyltransferase [Actinokineospora auranticolor]
MAESFGTDADRYDRARPAYPDALITRIVEASPGRAVVDVGCGTGIAARQFQARGCTVLGVEPDRRMAEIARRHLPVEVSTIEDWDPADRRFDAMTAAQSWHWVDPTAGAAKAAQALRPTGLFAAFWHVFDPPENISRALATAYRRVVPDSPIDFDAIAKTPREDRYRPIFDKTADGLHHTNAFATPETWHVTWEHPYTRDEWLDQLPTTGAMTQLPPDALAEILDDVGTAIDKLGGRFTMHYTTVAITAARNR